MWPDFTTLSPKEPEVPSLAVLYLTIPFFVVQQCDEVEDFTTPCPEMSCVTTLQLVWCGVTKIKILPPSVPGPRDTGVQIGAHGRPQLGCKQ